MAAAAVRIVCVRVHLPSAPEGGSVKANRLRRRLRLARRGRHAPIAKARLAVIPARLQLGSTDGPRPFGRLRSVREEDVLFEAGAAEYDFYVVIDGLVAVVDEHGDAERTLATHARGEFVGDLALLTGGIAFASAVVRQDGELYCLSATTRRSACSTYRSSCARSTHEPVCSSRSLALRLLGRTGILLDRFSAVLRALSQAIVSAQTRTYAALTSSALGESESSGGTTPSIRKADWTAKSNFAARC
jgi:CRP-like cAMP-binding protein